MSKYIAYKKDGEFDLDEGFIDQSCFKGKTNYCHKKGLSPFAFPQKQGYREKNDPI